MSFGPDEIRQILVDPSQFAADWSIVESQVSVGNLAWVPLVQANPRRIAVFFAISSVGNGQWTTQNSAPLSSGFNIPQGAQTTAERITYGSHGGLAQAALYAVGAGGAITVEVCEIIFNPLGG